MELKGRKFIGNSFLHGLWNSLPHEVIEAENFVRLKNGLGMSMDNKKIVVVDKNSSRDIKSHSLGKGWSFGIFYSL